MFFDLYLRILIPSLCIGVLVSLLLAARFTRIRWLRGSLLLLVLRFGLFHSLLFAANLLCAPLWGVGECSSAQWLCNVSLAALFIALFEALAAEVLVIIRRKETARLSFIRAYTVSFFGYAATILCWTILWAIEIGQSFGAG